MKATLASLLAAFLPALTIVSAIPVSNISRIDYGIQAISVGCTNIRLSAKRNLLADCLETTAWPPVGTINTELDLNDCLANYEGWLNFVSPPGGFANSCDCELIGFNNATMSCICAVGDAADNYNYNTFDLNNPHYIYNDQGTLKCQPPPPTYKRRMGKRYTYPRSG